jgi:N-acetylglutamate synthase-like GNAT family acetyltransferase
MIREMTERDLLRCHEITRLNWDDAVADRAYRQMEYAVANSYLGPKTIFYVYEENEKILGYAGMQQSWIMSGVWDFIWINIDKNHQGTKIGRYLTLHRIEQVHLYGGSVIMLMTKEYPYFERFGFRINRVHDDWAHMSLQLNELKI